MENDKLIELESKVNLLRRKATIIRRKNRYVWR